MKKTIKKRKYSLDPMFGFPLQEIKRLQDALNTHLKEHREHDPVKTYWVGDAGYDVGNGTVTTTLKNKPKQECTCKKPKRNGYYGVDNKELCWDCNMPLPTNTKEEQLEKGIKELDIWIRGADKRPSSSGDFFGELGKRMAELKGIIGNY